MLLFNQRNWVFGKKGLFQWILRLHRNHWLLPPIRLRKHSRFNHNLKIPWKGKSKYCPKFWLRFSIQINDLKLSFNQMFKIGNMCLYHFDGVLLPRKFDFHFFIDFESILPECNQKQHFLTTYWFQWSHRTRYKVSRFELHIFGMAPVRHRDEIN